MELESNVSLSKGERHRSLEKLLFRLSSYLSTFQNFVEIILKEQNGIWPGHMEIAIKIYSVYEELGKPSLTAQLQVAVRRWFTYSSRAK